MKELGIGGNRAQGTGNRNSRYRRFCFNDYRKTRQQHFLFPVPCCLFPLHVKSQFITPLIPRR